MDAAECVEGVYCSSKMRHDAEKTCRWYHRAPAALGADTRRNLEIS